MAEIDTSIYRPVDRPSIMDRFRATADTASALTQNRLLRMEAGARQGTADAISGAINPDGTIDTNKLLGSAGMAGYQAGDVIKAGQDIQTAQQNLNAAQTNSAYSMFGSLLNKSGAVNYDDAASVVTDLMKQRRITPQVGATLLRELPTDPKALKAYLAERYSTTLPPEVATSPTDLGVDQATGVARQGTRGQFINKATGSFPSTDMGDDSGAGGVPSNLPAGQAESMKASSDAWSDLRNDIGASTGSAARLFQLNKALGSLQGAKTGAGTEWQNDLKNFVISNAPTLGKIAGIDPASVQNYDEAQKYLTAYASGQAGAMGPKTDTGLATALTANASTHISNLAAQDVVKANIALERMRQAQAATFASAGGQPGEFLDWSSDWNRNVDARAFAVDLMDADKLTKMFGGLKGAEKQRFLDSLRIAINAGVVDPSTLPGAKANTNAQ